MSNLLWLILIGFIDIIFRLDSEHGTKLAEKKSKILKNCESKKLE